jgi:signal transduction histidine kinase
MLAGIGASAALWSAGVFGAPLWAALPLIGGLAGYAFELRRTNKANLAIGEEVNDALRDLARDDAESRHEVIEHHRRQREWTRLMEEQVAERTTALDAVLEQIQALQAARSTAILGHSHDLKGPFAVLYSGCELLYEQRDRLEAEARSIVEDHMGAAGQARALLDRLMELARSGNEALKLTPVMLEVEPLVEILRRRVRAFALGRDIRVSSFATREAPPRIETDRLLFDRVVDNLLTNAAKYTERGSIVVELDGKPGFLTIKVSDTGRGIAPEEIARIFSPRGSDPQRRSEGSHGVGLSVVVQLMAQIGGELEVMSLPGKGTTFWAHFPVAMAADQRPRDRTKDGRRFSPEEMMGTVVKIRPPRSAP